MDRDRLATAGLWLLAPAPAIFAVRSLLLLADQPYPGWLGPVTGAGGALSLVGLILAAVGAYRTVRQTTVFVGVGLALLGHYVLGAIDAVALWGPALVYLGTGVVAMPQRRLAVAAGAVAGVGVLLRDGVDGAGDAGHALIAVGAAALCVLLVLAGRDLQRP